MDSSATYSVDPFLARNAGDTGHSGTGASAVWSPTFYAGAQLLPRSRWGGTALELTSLRH